MSAIAAPETAILPQPSRSNFHTAQRPALAVNPGHRQPAVARSSAELGIVRLLAEKVPMKEVPVLWIAMVVVVEAATRTSHIKQRWCIVDD